MISIICSSNRPHLWKEFISNFKNTNKFIEIIFVGPIKPNFKLPQNYTFILSKYKPVQCIAIGIKQAKSPYFLIAADDLFIKKKLNLALYLEKSIQFYKKKQLLSPRYFLNNEDFSEGLKFHPNDDFYLPIFNIFSKEDYTVLEGFDINFIGILYEVDFYLRAIQKLKFKVTFSNLIELHENNQTQNKKGNLSKDLWVTDRRTLEYLWEKKNKKYFRKKMVEPYIFENIDTIHQGKKGRWGGFINKNTNFYNSTIFINFRIFINKLFGFLYFLKNKFIN